VSPSGSTTQPWNAIVPSASHVAEPSSAVPLACLLERTLDLRGARAGVIVTGGNVDLDRLPWQQ